MYRTEAGGATLAISRGCERQDHVCLNYPAYHNTPKAVGLECNLSKLSLKKIYCEGEIVLISL